MGYQYFQTGSFTLAPTGYSAGGSFGFGTIQYVPAAPTPFNALPR